MPKLNPDPSATVALPGRQAAPVEAEDARADWRRTFGLREMGVYYALIALVLILSAMTTYMGKASYLSAQNLTNVLYQSSLTAMMGVAVTVILITGNFDLSVASVAALSAAVLVGTCDRLGFFGAMALAMLIAIVCGLINGLIVQGLKINAFIVTLGTLTAYRGLVLIYTDGRSLQVGQVEIAAAMRNFDGLSLNAGVGVVVIGICMAAWGLARTARVGRLDPGGLGRLLGGAALAAVGWLSGFDLVLRAPVIFTGSFVALLWFVLNFTTLGRKVYAVGGNPEAARLSGINVFSYRLGAFVLCSAAAGFAGVLFASRLRSVSPTALQGLELTVIASAILGGTSLFGGAGSVLKTVAGALLLYTLTNGFNMLNVKANYQGLVEGIVVVAAAAIYTVGAGVKR